LQQRKQPSCYPRAAYYAEGRFWKERQPTPSKSRAGIIKPFGNFWACEKEQTNANGKQRTNINAGMISIHGTASTPRPPSQYHIVPMQGA
jgi:hypothetical protein